jgi:hypothetical protein
MNKKKIFIAAVSSLILAVSINISPVVSKASQKIYTKEYMLNGVTVIETKEYTQAMVNGNGSYEKLYTTSIKNKATSQLIRVDGDKESATLGWNYWYYSNSGTDPASFIVYAAAIDSNGNFSDISADAREKFKKVAGKYYPGCQKDYAEGMYDPAGHRKAESTKTQTQNTTAPDSKNTSALQPKAPVAANTNTTTDNKKAEDSNTSKTEEKAPEGELIKDWKAMSTKNEGKLAKTINFITVNKFAVGGVALALIAILVFVNTRRIRKAAENINKSF